MRQQTDGLVEAAIVVIAIVLAAAAISALRSILTPLALAFFLMVVIDALARGVSARVRWLPRWAAPAVAIAVVVLAVIAGLTVLADGAREFIAEAKGYGARLDALDAEFARAVGMHAPPPATELLRRAHLARRMLGFARALEDTAAVTVFVLTYLAFLLASRAAYQVKSRRLFASSERTDQALKALERIRGGIETYVLLQTFTALLIAGLSFALLAAVGLDDAPFWAFVIFIASYIPVLGGAVSILLPPVFALVQFETHWQAIVLLLAGEAIHLFVGNVVAPRMQGSRLNIDPLVVVFSLVFWTALLGVPGAFMSTPLTVTVVVILSQFPRARWAAVILSKNGVPERWSGAEHARAVTQP